MTCSSDSNACPLDVPSVLGISKTHKSQRPRQSPGAHFRKPMFILYNVINCSKHYSKNAVNHSLLNEPVFTIQFVYKLSKLDTVC